MVLDPAALPSANPEYPVIEPITIKPIEYQTGDKLQLTEIVHDVSTATPARSASSLCERLLASGVGMGYKVSVEAEFYHALEALTPGQSFDVVAWGEHTWGEPASKPQSYVALRVASRNVTDAVYPDLGSQITIEGPFNPVAIQIWNAPQAAIDAAQAQGLVKTSGDRKYIELTRLPV